MLSLTTEVLNSDFCNAKLISRIAGRIISMSPALGPLSRLMSRQMYNFIQSQEFWYNNVKLPEGVITELLFWKQNIGYKNGFQIKKNTTTSKVIFTDASGHGFGGFILSQFGNVIAKGNFSRDEMAGSSTLRELLAVKYTLESFGHLLRDERILWFTDNSNLPKIIESGSSKLPLTKIALEIFTISLRMNVELHPVWIPREDNVLADKISKSLDTDSWGIDSESFAFIESHFGKFTYDRFADHENTKVQRFSSKFFCPNAEDVDAFTQDWSGEFNWICPPISHIGKALAHLKLCKAEGVFLLPEWRAAYFWPLFINEGREYQQ